MLNVQIDEKTVNSMLEKAINEKVEELAAQKYFMTYKELSEYLNISKP
ncbi:excisionase, partial [Bacillus thuringiensis]|nr:excisionase [Bacillus thuringiensis]